MSEIYQVSDMVVIKIIDIIHKKKIIDVDFLLFHAGAISVLKVGAMSLLIGHWNNFFLFEQQTLEQLLHNFVLSLFLCFFLFDKHNFVFCTWTCLLSNLYRF